MLIVKNIKREFENPSEGWHAATITEIRDLGLVESAFGAKQKILFVFETDQVDREGKPRKAFKRYTKTLHPKGGLRKALRSIIGSDPGDELDLTEITGRKVQLLIEHHESDGAVYANISAIMRVKPTEPPTGTPVVVPASDPNTQPKTNGSAAAALPHDTPEPNEIAAPIASGLTR